MFQNGTKYFSDSHKVRPRDTQIYLVKTLSCTGFDDLAFALLSNSSCMKFDLHKFFHSPKNVHTFEGPTTYVYFLKNQDLMSFNISFLSCVE